jgi:TonB family protein
VSGRAQPLRFAERVAAVDAMYRAQHAPRHRAAALALVAGLGLLHLLVLALPLPDRTGAGTVVAAERPPVAPAPHVVLPAPAAVHRASMHLESDPLEPLEPLREPVTRVPNGTDAGPDLDVAGEIANVAPPPPASELRRRGAVAGVVTAPVLLPESRVLPTYPRLARERRLGGVVVLHVQVRADGSVGAVRVMRVSASGAGFEEAASAAVRRWRYRPGQRDGQPVESYTVAVVRFAPDG